MAVRSRSVESRTPDGVMAFFQKEILYRLQYTMYEINTFVDEYLNRKGITAQVNRHHRKSQIQDDIRSKQITVKTLFRLLDIFQVLDIVFNVRLVFQNQSEYVFDQKYPIRDKEEDAPHLFRDVSLGLIELFDTDKEMLSLASGFSKPWREIRSDLRSKKMTVKVFMRCLEYMRVSEIHFSVHVNSLFRKPFTVSQGFLLHYRG